MVWGWPLQLLDSQFGVTTRPKAQSLNYVIKTHSIAFKWSEMLSPCTCPMLDPGISSLKMSGKWQTMLRYDGWLASNGVPSPIVLYWYFWCECLAHSHQDWSERKWAKCRVCHTSRVGKNIHAAYVQYRCHSSTRKQLYQQKNRLAER